MPKNRTELAMRCRSSGDWTRRLGRRLRAIAATPRSLSDGRTIPADVAILIIANVSVEPANDGLFPNLLAQTWRMK